MLQPKKPNPNQKSKRLTFTKGEKSPASYDVDWDKVRSVNDNVAVQAAKMFDPTGISSYPDVYYAGKDLYEGKGSVGNLALNVLGALPVIGEVGRVANASSKISKILNKVNKVERVLDKAEKIAPKIAKVMGNVGETISKVSRGGKVNPIGIAAKTVGKVGKGVVKADEVTRRALGREMSKLSSSAEAGQITDIATKLLNVSNTASDVNSIVQSSEEPSTELNKEKTIQYYNTDPKRGEVEKPGQLANVQYVPVSNSAELKMWQEQKLALGTGGNGIEPEKRKLNVNLDTKGFADIGVEASHPNFSFNSGMNFNPEELAGRVGASFNNKGFNSSVNYSQKEGGDSRIDANLGYQNNLFQGNAGYSKTNEGDTFSGNLETGNDKLRVLMNYLSNPEGTNVTGGIQNSTNIGKGRLNSALEFASNFQDPKVSGNLNYTTSNGININAGTSYSKGEGTNINAGVRYNFALGTDKDGIMKKGMNPRKKYAAGTAAITPNGIPSPATTLNDYQIMMAKAEEEAASNAWLPVVATVGGLAQSAIGLLQPGTGTKDANAVKAANGMNNVNADVEVEGGEMYETPQGETGEFQGPSHEQGGIPMEVNENIPEGTKVYSDRLKVGKETLAERKANRERQIANLEKIASQPLVDSAVKNATKRKMEAIQKEEIADLQFQEQVNNMQQMADTIVKAFGTSMAGVQANPIGDSMRYGMGTGADGVTEYEGGTGPKGIVYGKGYNADMFKDFYSKYNELNPGGVMDMGFIQGDLGMDSKTKAFGKIFGPGTYKASQDWLAANKDKTPDGYVTGDINEDGIKDSLANNSNINLDALKDFKIGEGINDNASLSYGDPYAEDGVNAQKPVNTVMTPVSQYGEGVGTGTETEEDLPGNKVTRAIGKIGEIPGVGDMVSLFGNYLGATSGLKNAASQRASDITHTNVYKNAGKESQKQLDNAMQSIEGSKAQAIIKATSTARGGKKGGRGSARGINQMRAMDWLYDTALNQQIADISTNAAGQVSDIFKAKSSVAMNADQLSGQGEYQAAMANEAAKDAYYTAKGLGLKDQSMAVQQTGKDLNAMKQNKIIENLMKQYGTYVMANSKGDIQNKPTK